MFRRIRNLFRPKLEPMNVIKIYKDRILFNFGLLQGLHPDDHIFPVLKSNAYGHGLKEVLRILQRLPVPYVVVDSIPEYFIVKNNSSHNVLLLGETLPGNYNQLDFTRVTPCVWSVEVLKELLDMNKKIIIHVFLNTGMNREGLDSDQLHNFLEIIKKHKYGKNILIEGALSHFAEADNEGYKSIETQVKKFKELHQILLDYGHVPSYRHIGNSAATLKMDDKFFNAWRPGLAMYGYNPVLPEDEVYAIAKALRPSMSISSRIVAVQTIKEGESVGYDSNRKAPSDTTVVTVPFGYNEGMMRNMMNKIFIKHKKDYLAQIGSVCMNLACFVVPDGSSVAVGDSVELISIEKDAHNSITAWAQAAETIEYEVLVGVDGGLRREIVIE